ncbi:DUF192 domain-containing protein [Sphingomonas sp. LMO-1]|uniref:DUF192 domain-containing protein n=1 Tax=Alterirhizorhabdus profundi TaxID=2681549 RepID=UPI0012E74B2B
MRIITAVALGLIAGPIGWAAIPAAADAPTAAATAPSPATRLPLTIRTAGGTRAFRVEVARTDAEQARGLMFRKHLAPDAGMIFPFSPPRPAAFWMRNTLIPLDMVFIRADGTIARIAANATPLSLATVESGEPVAAVLEIAGGRAAALGIAAGDVVRWPG